MGGCRLEAGELPCRVFLTLPVQVLDEDAALEPLCHDSGLLSCDRVKLWTDGALGASTAALLEPYSDDKENRGVLQLSPDSINEAMAKAKARGFRVEAHAIGDRAATELLNSFEKHYSPTERPGSLTARFSISLWLRGCRLLGLLPTSNRSLFHQTSQSSSSAWGRRRRE